MLPDIPQLPGFLDPLLDFLYEHLPPELYSFITSFLSHSLALLTAFISLVSSVLASKPWEWDAQTIVPPLISFLAAYLALVSLYRTTSWMFRSTFWLVKWGMIFGLVAVGANWYMANSGTNGRGDGLMSTLGAILLGALNGDAQGGAGTRFPESTPLSSNRRTKKPWESFKKGGQYPGKNSAQTGGNDAQQIMSSIVATANRILVEGGWLDTAKSVFSQTGGEEGRSTKRRGSEQSRR